MHFTGCTGSWEWGLRTSCVLQNEKWSAQWGAIALKGTSYVVTAYLCRPPIFSSSLSPGKTLSWYKYRIWLFYNLFLEHRSSWLSPCYKKVLQSNMRGLIQFWKLLNINCKDSGFIQQYDWHYLLTVQLKQHELVMSCDTYIHVINCQQNTT